MPKMWWGLLQRRVAINRTNHSHLRIRALRVLHIVGQLFNEWIVPIRALDGGALSQSHFSDPLPWRSC